MAETISNTYYTILTLLGKSKLVQAMQSGTMVSLTEIKLGDSAGSFYSPSESATNLKNVVWSGSINRLAVDSDNSNRLIAEVNIPATAGGFYIREAGLYDSSGVLFAIGSVPETYKPVMEQGASRELLIRLIFEVSNTAAVTLKVDPSIVMATRAYADTLVTNHVHNGVSPNPSKIDMEGHTKSISADLNAFAAIKDTLSGVSPVLPVSAAEELRQLRGQIKGIQGTNNWYDAAPTSLSSSKTHALSANKHLFIQSNTSQSTLTADNAITSLGDGSIIIFVPVINVGANATLDIGFGAKPIKVISSTTGQLSAISADKLLAAKMYPLKYSFSDTCFICTAYREQWLFLASGVSTWYAPFSGMYDILVVAGGGGGGALRNVNPGAGGASGSGSAGGYSQKRIALTTGTSVSITVGSGGAGGLTSGDFKGQPGTSSSFGTHASASGGLGSEGRYISSGNGTFEPGISSAAFGGYGAGGDINGAGGAGKSSFYSPSPSGYTRRSQLSIGGSSILSFSIPSAPYGAEWVGGAPGTLGSGGGGALINENNTAQYVINGAKGGDGVVIIKFLGGN